MAHFAEINTENKVIRVVVVPDTEEHRGQDYLSNDLGLGGIWVQTSYNGNIRCNFAGVGYTYDLENDVFIAPKPNNAIGFNEENYTWIVPELEL